MSSQGEETRVEDGTSAANGAQASDAAIDGVVVGDSEDLFVDADDDSVAPATAETVAAAAGAANAASAEIGALKARIATLEGERKELQDRFMRKAADFENARRRHEKERDEMRAYAGTSVLKEMVSVLDDLDRAVQHLGGFARGASGSDEAANVAQGVEMVLRKFATALEKQGVKGESAVGQRFNPELHEAIQQVADASVPHNTVVREFQKAYTLHERLLRPAIVVVATGGPANPTVSAPVVEDLESATEAGDNPAP